MSDLFAQAHNNYTAYPNKCISAGGGMHLFMVPHGTTDISGIFAACDELTTCHGILKTPGGNLSSRQGGNDAYQLIDSSITVGQACNDQSVWIKKGTPPHKAQDFVDGIGILPQNGDTKVVVCADSSAAQTGYSSGSCQGFGRSAQLTGVQGFGDNIHSMYVPLGLKAMVDLDYLEGGNYGGNKDQTGVGYNFTNSGPAISFVGSINTQNGEYGDFRNGWNPGNGISTLIIGQTPINMSDIGTFQGLESRGVGTNDARILRYNFCSNLATIDRTECKNFLSLPSNGYDFDVVKTNLCNQDPNWHSNPTCVAAINSAQKTGSQAGKDTATEMVRVFCSANPTDPLCACYNVTLYGSQCISDSSKQSIPGCDNLKNDFGSLPSYASVLSADKFCASSDCITGALSANSALMPVGRSPQQTCPTIQACIQDFRNAQFNGSSLTASCQQTLNIGGAPPGAAVGASPPSPAGTPSPTGSDGSTLPITNPAVANVLDTSTKQYGAIGALVFCILICCCLLLLLMGGDEGGSGSNALAARLALAGL
jgi:hypothetical protein